MHPDGVSSVVTEGSKDGGGWEGRGVERRAEAMVWVMRRSLEFKRNGSP